MGVWVVNCEESAWRDYVLMVGVSRRRTWVLARGLADGCSGFAVGEVNPKVKPKWLNSKRR